MSMDYRLAIFDFDGTLANSFPFFVSAHNELARKHGFKPVAPEEVPALRQLSTREILAGSGVQAWKLPAVARDFMALMREKGDAIRLFDGVGQMLRELSARGVLLCICTSNARDNVERVLGPDKAGLFAHMDCGISMTGKGARLAKLLQRTGVSAERAIYIADQDSDAEAARSVGIDFGAVGWGYGSLDMLKRANPRHVFVDVHEITGLLAPAGPQVHARASADEAAGEAPHTVSGPGSILAQDEDPYSATWDGPFETPDDDPPLT